MSDESKTRKKQKKKDSRDSKDNESSGSEDESRSGSSKSEKESKSGSEDEDTFSDGSLKYSETMTTEPDDSSYIDHGYFHQLDISHDDLFVPSSPLGDPARETQQGLDRNAQNRNQFLENFYNENYKKLDDYEMMRSFLMDLMVENMPDLMHGIDSPRMIGEGIKFIVDNLKQRFDKFRCTVFDEDKRKLSNEELMGKIKNLRNKTTSLFSWYATEMVKINEENFILKDQNAKLKAHIHSMQQSEEKDEQGGPYTAEKLQRFLRMMKRENSGLNEVLSQAKDQNSQLWLVNAELRRDLVTCIGDKQILTTQLAQVLDMKKMFQEAVQSVLKKDEDSSEKPSKEACHDMVQKWIRSMEKTFTETDERLHQAVSKLDKIREDLGQKETEIIETKEQFEEIDNQVNLLDQTLYMKKVSKKKLETAIKYMSQRIKIDGKYSDELKKIYKEFKKLHEAYVGRYKSLNTTGDTISSSEEIPTSSAYSPSRPKPPGPSPTYPTAPGPSPTYPSVPGPSPTHPSPGPSPTYPSVPGPSRTHASPDSQTSAYGLDDSSKLSPIIKGGYIDYETPTPSAEISSYGSVYSRTPSPYSQDSYSEQKTSSAFVQESTFEPDFSPSPINKGYVDYNTERSIESDFSPSPIIKGYVDYDTPSTSGSPWRAGSSTTESPNSFAKSMLLTSPGRKDPLKVDVEVDPKLLKKTASGDHFVCDISVNMQDITKRLKRRETTPFRRRKITRTHHDSPPPITVAKSRRPRGIFSPKSVFKKQMVGRRDLFGKGYQSPEPPLGSGRWHGFEEYDLAGWERPERRLDEWIPWETSDQLEPAVIRGRYTPSPPSTSLGSTPFYYQSDRLSEPMRKSKFVTPSGRAMRFPQPHTPLSLQ